MPDIATLHQRLSEAEAAYHRYMIGDRESEIQFTDGRRVRLSEANAEALRRYIDELRTEIVRARAPMAAGPIGFMF